MNDPKLLIGKVILIGVSLYRADDTFIRKTQVHGVVKEFDPEAGIVIEDAATGREFYLPPALSHIHAAAPGVYRARNTGDEVTDPDFVTQWAVRLAAGADESTINWTEAMEWSAGPCPKQVRLKLH
jgi:hypothetical protein